SDIDQDDFAQGAAPMAGNEGWHSTSAGLHAGQRPHLYHVPARWNLPTRKSRISTQFVSLPSQTFSASCAFRILLGKFPTRTSALCEPARIRKAR
ncbi:hypothetical protein OEZ84_25995, partial [Leclercia adecarboxylata]|uniref:hypothetical protein n=1 Tax=Leclercia adecarboxylata TaxID=83655 RepID=UPI00234DB5F5